MTRRRLAGGVGRERVGGRTSHRASHYMVDICRDKIASRVISGVRVRFGGGFIGEITYS